MPTAASNGIEIAYETFGDPEDPTVLLIMGLGAQMLGWPDPFCEGLVDRGFHVVRFDNRDVGLSTWFDHQPVDLGVVIPQLMAGDPSGAPYVLRDMAADAVGLLDVLSLDQVHLVGASMGGMIAQTIAIEHPERVLSLTSIMSTTGEQHVGQPTPEILGVLMQPPARDRDAAIEQGIATYTAIGSPDHLDPEWVRHRVTASYDRAFHPEGTSRQLVAVGASGSRADGLASLEVPTLVVHGEVDPLIDVSGGERTAELVPGAELLIIEEMGHDLPAPFWPQIIEGITRTAVRAATVDGGS
ncbi:alpha/beta hydrolase [cyanobacterium TDX16]|nr:alpha/beta hydrolase [cyanobacterium TDX16]